jgi:hypothetical protein
VFLVALGIFLTLSIFWLPNLLARLLGLGGGLFGGSTGIAYVQVLIAPASIGTGVLLLLLVRPLLRLRSRVLPFLLIAASVAMLVRQSAVCPVADTLLRFPPETETCAFVAPALFPSLLFWSVVFAIRSWQLLRH